MPYRSYTIPRLWQKRKVWVELQSIAFLPPQDKHLHLTDPLYARGETSLQITAFHVSSFFPVAQHICRAGLHCDCLEEMRQAWGVLRGTRPKDVMRRVKLRTACTTRCPTCAIRCEQSAHQIDRRSLIVEPVFEANSGFIFYFRNWANSCEYDCIKNLAVRER